MSQRLSPSHSINGLPSKLAYVPHVRADPRTCVQLETQNPTRNTIRRINHPLPPRFQGVMLPKTSSWSGISATSTNAKPCKQSQVRFAHQPTKAIRTK